MWSEAGHSKEFVLKDMTSDLRYRHADTFNQGYRTKHSHLSIGILGRNTSLPTLILRAGKQLLYANQTNKLTKSASG